MPSPENPDPTISVSTSVATGALYGKWPFDFGRSASRPAYAQGDAGSTHIDGDVAAGAGAGSRAGAHPVVAGGARHERGEVRVGLHVERQRRGAQRQRPARP